MGWKVTITVDSKTIQDLAEHLMRALGKYGISINPEAAAGIIKSLVTKLKNRGK